MSSLRLALRLSLQESHAPNTYNAVKGKKAALRIVTPEKENVPLAASRRKETIWPPPPANIIFSNVPTLAEIATKLQVSEKSL
jgi:hypothetical protein